MVAVVKHNGFDYKVIDRPENLKYVPRTEFIQALCGTIEATPRPLEDIISDFGAWHRHPPKVQVSPTTLELAQTYVMFRNRGARLPKFSRWATGMFKDDKVLAKDLAACGKTEDSSSDIVISGDVMDLLRNADTTHFNSCLKAGGSYEKVTRGIVEDCPGIAIAYIDDENGRMRGRCWVHHAERADNGATVAVVCHKWGGTLDAIQVVESLRKRGFEAYVGGSYGKQYEGHDAIKVNFVGGFKVQVHHDMYTWVRDFKVHPLNG